MALISLRLDRLLSELGPAGKRLSEMGAAEGAAGNLSICFREELGVDGYFPAVQTIDLPVSAPDLVGATVIVTGSGRRLRDIMNAPTANLACIRVEPGGRMGKMFTARDCQFQRVTSEFNSHLAVHHDQMRRRDIQFHALLHGQPLYLTFLSHLESYQAEAFLNRHLLRWQPETLMIFPEGLGVLPFMLPGSAQLTTETMLALRDHHLVVWSRHGVMARAEDSILHALDRVEYPDAAANYEVLNLMTGDLSGGLSPDHLRSIASHWQIRQKIF